LSKQLKIQILSFQQCLKIFTPSQRGNKMKMTIKMPRVGETVDEVYLVTWHKKAGDVIAIGDNLMDVETDKATVEVPSPIAGTIIETFFKDGDEIKTGTPIATVEG
jgi:glutaconyl-CoA/methylmalonyl-CoA decarboxylase subunit gamma